MSEMSTRERDLVLNPNEYAFVLDKTKGLISCVVGSHKMSLSNSDALVVFDEDEKKFVEARSMDEAITTFTSAPENWYVVLKNPTADNSHPQIGTSNSLPKLNIGKKINITGNVSFALYPGQMAKVIQGHRLHSNQYLLARVYDADVLEKEEIDIPDGVDENEQPKTKKVSKNKYSIGEILVIKGTEVPFYIPPTGIEVIPIGGHGTSYVRDAVTLENLEYCILKDEEGNKKYVKGPAVVFPEPDETFVKNDEEGGFKFRAIELSDISGIYVKVIAPYKDEDGTEHKVGEELFITGKDQMIYYPRHEHAIIDYNGQIVHHAIAIPVGEGRYILDRNTGNIKTVKGPSMYLPDPRTEVLVKRKLTAKQCELWFPGNREVLRYNAGINENDDYRRDNDYDDESLHTMNFMSNSRSVVTDKSGFSRKTTYTQPRFLVIDNKFNGVVTIDIWTGYAINVISKKGDRKVITGPTTHLMEYDETLEVLELSTGKPKTTDNLLRTVYLRVENNKISDLINVQTKDFVNVAIKVSYCLDFLPEYKDKWFSVENYIKYMCDRQRSLMKREAKKYTIEELYNNVTDIVRKVALNLPDETSEKACEETADAVKKKAGRLFKENGMLVHDVEVLSIDIDDDIQYIIDKNQQNIIEQSLKLSNASQEIEVAKKIAEVDKLKYELRNTQRLYENKLNNEYEKDKITKEEEIARLREENEKKSKEATKNLQVILDAIQESELNRDKEVHQAQIDAKKNIIDLESQRQINRATAIVSIMSAVTPELIAAMEKSSNAELIQAVAESMSPLAIANGESVADTTNKLIRGTALEPLFAAFLANAMKEDTKLDVLNAGKEIKSETEILPEDVEDAE